MAVGVVGRVQWFERGVRSVSFGGGRVVVCGGVDVGGEVVGGCSDVCRIRNKSEIRGR